MALDDVLDMLQAACADPDSGLGAQCARILEAKGLPRQAVRLDFSFDDWILADGLKPAGPRMVFTPRNYDANIISVAQAGQREARARLEAQLTTVDGDMARLRLAMTTYTTALLLVLDGLFAYSAARGGTIALVEDPCTIAYGAYSGGSANAPTEHGFSAQISILERSRT